MRTAVNHAALANLYNPAGGCFDGGCLVTMADGSRKPAREVRVGDLVRPAVGGEAGEVFVVLRTRVPATAEAVRLRGGLAITAWHPVRRDEPGAAWIFPRDAGFADVSAAGTAATVGLGLVFSFGVRGTRGEAPAEVHGLRVDGVLVASLGHGVQGDAVLTHAFYGSRLVLDAIAQMQAAAAAQGQQEPVVGENGWAFTYDSAKVPTGLSQISSVVAEKGSAAVFEAGSGRRQVVQAAPALVVVA